MPEVNHRVVIVGAPKHIRVIPDENYPDDTLLEIECRPYQEQLAITLQVPLRWAKPLRDTLDMAEDMARKHLAGE